jgi:hypothetical protein
MTEPQTVVAPMLCRTKSVNEAQLFAQGASALLQNLYNTKQYVLNKPVGGADSPALIQC